MASLEETKPAFLIQGFATPEKQLGKNPSANTSLQIIQA